MSNEADESYEIADSERPARSDYKTPSPSNIQTRDCDDGKKDNKDDEEEEDDGSDLELLSRQLSLLNEQSGSLATPIHKSTQQKRQEMAKKHRETPKKYYSSLRSPSKPFSQYKSPSRKFGFMLGRGVKRSPCKPGLGVKKPKRKKLKLAKEDDEEDSNPEEDEEDSVRKESREHHEEDEAETGAEGDLENSDDDSDEEQWQIMEDSETEIDKTLEDRAQKNHLTARNVKSILHQVITNEHVVEMVRNTLKKDQGEDIEVGQAVYEPKMTRAKVKQTMEENGEVLHPWPITPLKKKNKKKAFLDLELSESEADSDTDFDPTVMPSSLSDEDSESMASSQLSDFGSPSTPATPRSSLASTSDLDRTPSVRGEGDKVMLSPMGPPVTPYAHKKSLGRKFQEAMAENERLQEEENIARRTRSKVSLEDTSILDLEANFVPPDFTPDMYDTDCYVDDDVYRGFLTSLIKPPDNENTNDTVDDEDNDPEFNILEEIDKISEELTKDREKDEMRNDRGVQVSKREMNQLMDELFQFYEDMAEWEDEDRKTVKNTMSKAKSQFRRKWTEPGDDLQPGDYIVDNIMTMSQREQLGDQMRKHVQLLTQMYVLANGSTEDYSTVASSSKVLLNELHKFKVQNSAHMTSSSAYDAANIDEAYKLVNEEREWEMPSKHKGKTKGSNTHRSIASMLMKNYDQLTKFQKDKIMEIIEDPTSKCNFDASLAKVLPELTAQQKQILWSSSVFMYPELLPSFGFSAGLTQKSQNQRVVFTEAEDNLIAIGLEQFGKLPYFRNLIQKFLLPTKTPDQIKIRIKNLGCAKATDNAVKFFRTNKKLPPFPRYTGMFQIIGMKPPKEQNIQSLPHWCKELKIQEIFEMKDDRVDSLGNIQRSRSVPLVTAEKHMVEEEHSNSAPATPMTQTSTLTSRAKPSSTTTMKPKPNIAIRKLSPDKLVETYSSPTPCVSVTYVSTESGGQSSEDIFSSSSKCSPTLPKSQQISRSTKGQGLRSSSRTSLRFNEEVLPPGDESAKDNNSTMSEVHEEMCPLPNLEDFMPKELEDVQSSHGLVDKSEKRQLLVVQSENSSQMCIQSESSQLMVVQSESSQQMVVHAEGSQQMVVQSESSQQMIVQSESSQQMVVQSEVNREDMLNQGIIDNTLTSPSACPSQEKTVDMESTEAEVDTREAPITTDSQPQLTDSPVKNVLSLTQSGETLIMSVTDSSYGEKTPSRDDTHISDVEMDPAVAESEDDVSTSDLSVCEARSSANLIHSDDQTVSSERAASVAVETLTNDVEGTCACEVETDGSGTAKSQSAVSISSLSEKQMSTVVQTPPKSALEIVASYARFIVPPSSDVSVSQRRQEMTPKKKNSTRYRPLAPKPTTSPIRPVPPIFDKKSPRRQQLQRKAQAICPKGLVVKPVIVSPSKKAADIIIKQALRRGNRKILPKPPSIPSPQLTIRTRSSTRRQLEMSKQEAQQENDDDNMETASEYDTAGEGYLSDDVLDDSESSSAKKPGRFRQSCLSESGRSVESDDLQSENEDTNLYDSQNEENDEELMADLMAASTTIAQPDRKTARSGYKAKRKKELALSLLDPDIVETDPMKDDKDMSFAQAYLSKVKDTLRHDLGVYEQFLKVLYEFGKAEQSPTKLYKDMAEILSSYPELIHDFAGFLLPHQAVQCGCFMATQEFMSARMFLRKLEIYFERNPGNYHKVIKILSRWSRLEVKDPRDLKEALEPVFKNQPHLKEQFSLFFGDERPPDSMMTDFEEVTLDDSDDEEVEITHDGFEELILPEEEEPNGTKKCQCSCHQNPRLIHFHKRIKHCYSCCLKVINGELYYKINKQVLRKVRVTRHQPIKAKNRETNPDPGDRAPPPALHPPHTDMWTDEDEEMAEKENVRVVPQSKPRQLGIKLKISSKKKGKHKRFYTLKEMTESPRKTDVTNSDSNIDASNGSVTNNNIDTSYGSESTQQAPETVLHFLPDVVPQGDSRRASNGDQVEMTSELQKSLLRHPAIPNVSHTEGREESVKQSAIPCTNSTQSEMEGSSLSDTVSTFVPQSLEESVSADILAKALKEAMISQNDVTLDTSMFGETGRAASHEDPGSKQQEYSETEVASGASEDVNQNQHDSEISVEQKSENPKSNISEMSSVSHSDTSNYNSSATKDISVTKQRNLQSEGHSAPNVTCEKRRITPVPVPDDKLCTSPAFMIPANEDSALSIKSPASSGPVITYTNSPMVHSDSSTDSVCKQSGTLSKCSQKQIFSPPKQPSSVSSGSKNPSPKEGKPVDGTSDPKRPQMNTKQAPSPCPSSNQSWCSDSSRTIISSVIGFGDEGSSTASRDGVSRTERQAKEVSPRDGTKLTWTKDNDKLILETVKQKGPGSTTFDGIAKMISGRTANQISARFHQLLEMLAEEDTPSEGDTSEASSSKED